MNRSTTRAEATKEAKRNSPDGYTSKRGRPAKWDSPAAKQAAYRARKAVKDAETRVALADNQLPEYEQACRILRDGLQHAIQTLGQARLPGRYMSEATIERASLGDLLNTAEMVHRERLRLQRELQAAKDELTRAQTLVEYHRAD